MKKLPLFLFIAAIAFVMYLLFFSKNGSIKIPLESKAKTSKKSVKSNLGLGEYDKIEITGVFEVDVTYGSKERIEIEAPNHIKKRINTKVTSKTLYFELDNGTSPYAAGKVKVHITTTKLNAFYLSGAASVQLNNSLKDDSLTIRSSGAAHFSGDIDVEHAYLDLTGAAAVNVDGKAQSAHFELSGASKFTDYNFEVKRLNVKLSGASKVYISAIDSIKGSLSGASSLDYKGSPVVKTLEVSRAAHLTQH